MGFYFLVLFLCAILINLVIPLSVAAILCKKRKQQSRSSHLSSTNRAQNNRIHHSEDCFYDDHDRVFQNQQRLEQERIFREMNETAMRMHNEAVRQHEQTVQHNIENQFHQDVHMAQDFCNPFF